ncbi:hypothetical protein EI94DRAFT_1724044 [Lactarius quietus]|nr:hypothetical protein EI94DRAFT_1724044 [Lactarius quietus]
MPNYKYSSLSGVGAMDGDVREDEEDFDDSFDADEGTVIGDGCMGAASVSGPSGSSSEDNSVPTSMAPTMSGGTAISHKTAGVDFSCTTSSDSAELDDEDWVDPAPIPPTLLTPAPPAFPHPSLDPSCLAARRAVSVRRRASMSHSRRARWRTRRRADPGVYR